MEKMKIFWIRKSKWTIIWSSYFEKPIKIDEIRYSRITKNKIKIEMEFNADYYW